MSQNKRILIFILAFVIIFFSLLLTPMWSKQLGVYIPKWPFPIAIYALYLILFPKNKK